MGNIFNTFALVLSVIFAFGQEKQTPDLLLTDWGKETFVFPLGFARNIDYKGVEEARFSPEWSDKDKPGYWTYAFVWHVEMNTEVTERELEEKLKMYFDGLLSAVNKDRSFEVPKTVALFVKKDGSGDVSTYLGKLRIYDAFTTKQMITLNIFVESFACQATSKSVVFFRLSPKEIDHSVWQNLMNMKLVDNICDL